MRKIEEELLSLILHPLHEKRLFELLSTQQLVQHQYPRRARRKTYIGSKALRSLDLRQVIFQNLEWKLAHQHHRQERSEGGMKNEV